MPLEIGKTYLDIWGCKQEIMGFIDKKLAWSMHGHYEIATGKGGHYYDLVLKSRAAEIKYWKERIALIESVNSDDKLALIKDDLQNMRERLEHLETNLF